MHVTHLSLVDFRSYPTAEVELGPGATALVGRNGQGKTNLVEALGYVATLASHRVATDAPLVRAGSARAVVRAAVDTAGRSTLVELEITPGRANRARINRSPVPRVRDVLGVLRTVLFAPEDLALVKGDPDGRRRFCDEALVALAPRLAGVRADYDRVVRQRSALLRSAPRSRGGRGGASGRGGDGGADARLATLDVWDEHLAVVGAELLAARLHLVRRLQPHAALAYARVSGDEGAPELAEQLAGQLAVVGAGGPVGGLTTLPADPPPGPREGGPSQPGRAGSDGAGPDGVGPATDTGAGAPPPGRLVLGYRTSLPLLDGVDVTGEGPLPPRAVLEQALRDQARSLRAEELDRGTTLVGPHRDDLVLTLDGLPARGYASHGESWSCALALRLATWALMRGAPVDAGAAPRSDPGAGAGAGVDPGVGSGVGSVAPEGVDPASEPVLVLDDVFAELDAGRRARLADLVAGAEQVLVTAAVPQDVPAQLAGSRLVVRSGRVGPG